MSSETIETANALLYCVLAIGVVFGVAFLFIGVNRRPPATLSEKRVNDLISLESNIYYKPRFHFQITHGKNKGAFTCSSAPPLSESVAAQIRDERAELIKAGIKVINSKI